MSSTPLPPRLLLAAVTIVAAMTVAVVAGTAGSMGIMAGLFIVATIVRVWSVDQGRPMPRWASHLALGAGVVLATRLVLWFGFIGAVGAIVLIVLLLVAAGADLG